MHDTAMRYGELFFIQYVANSGEITILDIGGADVNGSLRAVAPPRCRYVGIDFAKERGVDVILNDPYELPFADASVDAVVSSSCFEHSEFFWLTFNEILRVLKPSGLLYLNVPSNGAFHRFPVDCWRFYPDSGVALQNWGRRSGYPVLMLESFTGAQEGDIWNDFIAVFLRDESHAGDYPKRIQTDLSRFSNGRMAGTEEVFRLRTMPEDKRRILAPIKLNASRGYEKLKHVVGLT